MTEDTCLKQLFSRLLKGLSNEAQMLLQGSQVSLTVVDHLILVLSLQEPWLMGDSRRSQFLELANRLEDDLGIKHIGIFCGDAKWVAVKSSENHWLVIDEMKYLECENAIV